MAALYHAKEEYAKAEPLYKRALVINETALGLDHLSVATSLRVWRRFMRKGKNMHGLNRAISVLWKLLIKLEHPIVAASLNNLATLYFVQMQHSQARPLYKRALEIWINALGSKHPDVATGLENLAELQRKTRQDKEAESLEKRAATIRAMQR